jgi:hypothetical protein
MALWGCVWRQVGQDLADTKSVLRRIVDDWNVPSSSLNRRTAYTFFKQLVPRMLAKDAGHDDGSIDVLVTGCEVSLDLT